jgi:oxygen-independent coproporphyrinogen-3 oxidase
MTLAEPGFGIYVHWPFCKAKCPYCDFNSHVRHLGVDSEAYTMAIARELTWYREQTGDLQVSSIFFGGGTPSLMPPRSVAHVLDTIAELWPVESDIEITLEANPTSAEAANFTGYRTAGVNRVSVGIQALNDDDLKRLGRQHSVSEALAAFRLAARIFPLTSFDLIYARPNQSVARWREELEWALLEQQGHMSLYQLTIEPGTVFGELHAKGVFPEIDEGVAADLYAVTQELTERAGLPAYEISNHAIPGQESRHNLIYWRSGTYVGAGPGAHSRIGSGNTRRALVNERHPETWLDLVNRQSHGAIEDEAVCGREQALEYLLMGLRIREGIAIERYRQLAGEDLARERVDGLIALGLLDIHQGFLRVTRRGRPLLNRLIAELAA